MAPHEWRAVELLAALATAAVLIGGITAGVPLLRARVTEALVYSFCCVGAVIVRSLLDLLARGIYLISLISSQLRTRAMMQAGLPAHAGGAFVPYPRLTGRRPTRVARNVPNPR